MVDLMNTKAHLRLELLYLLTFIEVMCLSYGLTYWPTKPASLWFFGSGMLIGVLALFKTPDTLFALPRRWSLVIMVLPLVLLLLWALPKIKAIFSTVPVDYHYADMLPIMEIMCRRFLGGTGVYRIIPEIWGGMQPIYLPAMWLPYLLATEIGFDLRWITVIGVFGAMALLYFWAPRRLTFSWASLAAYLPAFLYVYSFLFWDTRDLSMADEGPVIGFYVLLVWAIWHKNPWTIGIALALSVLTRYSLLPWIPFYLIWVWLFQSKRDAYIITATAAVLGFALMIGTGAIYELKMFMGLPKHYITAAMGKDYEKIKDVIEKGPGLAKFFRKVEFPLVHRFNIILTFVVPALLFSLYHRFRAVFNPDLFAIGVLKLTLVVFFNFLIMPIHNLFLPSVCISLAILIFYTQVKKEKKTAV